jgi:AraC family transcriptional regulator
MQSLATLTDSVTITCLRSGRPGVRVSQTKRLAIARRTLKGGANSMQQGQNARVGTPEVEIQLPLARLSIVRYIWTNPTEFCVYPTAYRLDLSPGSRPATGGGVCFNESSGRHQFKPIGELFLLAPGQAVRARVQCGQSSSIVCEFDSTCVDAWFDGDKTWTNSCLRAARNIASPTLRTSLRRIGEELRNPGFASVAICELLASQAVIDLVRYFKSDLQTHAVGGLPSWKLRLIDERLAEVGAAPTLSELAALCKISVRQLTRGFRESRGCSIGEHIAQKRLNYARHMLATGASVKEIAYQLGFTLPGVFSTAFRRATGETPRQFRERTGRRA